ncbi:MAG: Gx transporter family protein [Clostridia bacterium]|nr:Gx transporter family protein [Clostridia bacterium]
MNRKLYKMTLAAILGALGTLSFTIESLFPPLFLPGARLGISNIFILLSAIILGGRYGFIVLIIKTVLGSLFSGNPSMILYSLPSGAIALTVELIIIYAIKRTSVLSVSVSGAVINTTAQNIIFCLITNASEYLAYLPYLALISVVSGLFIGFAVYLVIRYLPEKYFVEEEKIIREEDTN